MPAAHLTPANPRHRRTSGEKKLGLAKTSLKGISLCSSSPIITCQWRMKIIIYEICSFGDTDAREII